MRSAEKTNYQQRYVLLYEKLMEQAKQKAETITENSSLSTIEKAFFSDNALQKDCFSNFEIGFLKFQNSSLGDNHFSIYHKELSTTYDIIQSSHDSGLDNSYSKKLLTIMDGESYTSGEVSDSELYVKKIFAEYGSEKTMNWLMKVYEVNFDNPAILIGLLHMISHFPYDIVSPHGPIMALALLQHKSTSVCEFAIKAFENWDSKKSLTFLKNIKCAQKWQQDYLDEVIYDIEC